MATNAMLVLPALGVPATVAVLALLFSFVCVAGFAMARDIVERSASALGTLKSVGATKSVVAAALTVTLMGFGGLGAVVGAGLGAGLGAAVGAPLQGLSVIGGFLATALVTSVAVGAGAYFGVVLAWHR